MAIESNCGGRDFENEWRQFNPYFCFYPRLDTVNKEKVTVLLAETYSTNPAYYNIDLLKQFKSIITWNSKFYQILKSNNIDAYLIPNIFKVCDLNEKDEELIDFTHYNNKINGICLISNLKTFFDGNAGAIGYKRMEAMHNLTGLIKHVYGGNGCSGGMYKGPVGDRNPLYKYVDLYACHMDKIKTVNKYKFELCFENCYHETWSWDYITEKIWDSFKAKTIPVYYGCYNIEQHIPNDLFIDVRKFKNYGEISNYLNNFPQEKYIEMIEKAYKFYLNMKPKFKQYKQELIELITKLK